MKHWFIYETFLGHGRIMSKRYKTEREIKKDMIYFPGADFCEVDARTYEYMQVGDAW